MVDEDVNLPEERCPRRSQIPEQRCPLRSQIPDERRPRRSQIPDERCPRRSIEQLYQQRKRKQSECV